MVYMLKISSLVALSLIASEIAALPNPPFSIPSGIDVPILPEETDGGHFVTIPPNTAGAFKWPFYDKPRIVVVNNCTAPITVRLHNDEGACVAQVYRGASPHYLLRGTGVGNFLDGGSGEHVVTFCDHSFQKHFPEDFDSHL